MTRCCHFHGRIAHVRFHEQRNNLAERFLEGGGESHEIGSQTVEEYLSGEERQNQCQEVENQVDAGVKQALLNSRFLCHYNLHECSPSVTKTSMVLSLLLAVRLENVPYRNVEYAGSDNIHCVSGPLTFHPEIVLLSVSKEMATLTTGRPQRANRSG